MNKYLEPIVDFLKSHDWNTAETEFINLQSNIVDNLEKENIGFEIMQDILVLMEKYPLVEFGSPGPLTHFIESFYNENEKIYENQLRQSVEENPSIHTVWLLNRVINGSQGEKKIELIEILNSTRKNERLPKSIRNVAENFFKYHND